MGVWDEFKFKCGDTVCLGGDKFHRMVVTQQALIRCPGGVQRHYFVAQSSGGRISEQIVSEAALKTASEE